MSERHVTPILNVSDIAASFAWFEKWGWKKLWDWGTPPGFGAVGSGGAEIFFALGAREAAAGGRTPLRLGQMEMKRPTRAYGVGSGGRR